MESQAKVNKKYLSFGSLYFKPSKIKWKILVFPFIVFQVDSYKNYKIELVYQLLYLLFYITSALK